MRLLPTLTAAVAALSLLSSCAPATIAPPRRVTILHFSDYHSHAEPFYSEGEADAAGIARAIAWLAPRAARSDTLVFSGGDMMNHGAPAWSDRYGCTEWPWLNGIVDAMAFGNHDADYGAAAFAACRAAIDYPILAANIVDAAGTPYFSAGGKPYAVFERNGARIGVFALAGSDFERLLRPGRRPFETMHITDRIETARAIVRALRAEENVDAVVVIGHAYAGDEAALARAVPGIDLILGTHGHLKQELTKIDGTSTFFISPFQYLTYIAKVTLTFDAAGLASVDGELIRMGAHLPDDPQRRTEVAALARDLRADPLYARLFRTVGIASGEIGIDRQSIDDAPLGNLVTEAVRSAIGADVFLATASTFREPLPPGVLTEELVRAALPYENEIIVYEMDGSDLRELLRQSVARRGSDFFSQVAGVRLRIAGDRMIEAQATDDGGTTTRPLDDEAIYRVAVSDYQARVADGYRDFFSRFEGKPTGLRMRDAFLRYLEGEGTVHPPADDRLVDCGVSADC